MTDTPKQQTREKPLHELLSHSMVDIYVGPENTHWILHEKLLCHRSKFFSSIFYKKAQHSSPNNNSRTKAFGLPDEDDAPFRLFVGWLYSSALPIPEKESDLTDLLDLYLMGEKWSISALVKDTLDAVRKYYRLTDTYPGLRRVQYIYANTDSSSPMRQLLVGSIARMLVLSERDIPQHWDKALRRNGQLAVDMIMAMRDWKVHGEDVPDPREEPGETEREMVKGVERAEKKQDGKAKDMGGNKEAEKDLEDFESQDMDSESTLLEA